jgi:transcriptional regulator with XRE-family HTH domain
MHDQRNPRGVPSAHHLFLGSAIRGYRVAFDRSHDDLARATQLHVNYVAALERGEIPATYSVLRRVAIALRVPVSSVVALAETLEQAGHAGGEVDIG